METPVRARITEPTPQQLIALRRLYQQGSHNTDYETFALKAVFMPLTECLMVPAWGMWIGIEADGYTHS